MHAPPAFDGRFAPHPEWGFNVREQEFLDLVRRHDVGLVCCAHALLFDHHVHDGTHFVVSGGGGTGLCSHFRGICAAGEGRPEDRGALFHAVADHRRRGRRDLRPRAPGLRPRRRSRTLALRRPTALVTHRVC